MSNDALLYTMSTVAAALGSAMALLAAFALYRLQSLSNQMQLDAEHLADTIGNFGGEEAKDRLTWLAASEDWDAYLPEMDRVRSLRADSDIGRLGRAWMGRLHANNRRRRSIGRALTVALGLTAAVMTGALGALAASETLRGCARVPWLGVAGFVICLTSYLVLIWLTLSKPPMQTVT